MVASFLDGVGQIFLAMLDVWDSTWSLYISGAVISSFFALWLLRRVLIYFDIIKS